MGEQPAGRIEREVRFAVVMYGGVSLAVYMNGVAQELLHLVRATTLDGDRAVFADDELGEAGASTARLYREIARLPVTSVDAAAPDPDAIHQRFVIDILSGTSAGGINAIVLAKAIANGQSMSSIATLWESEADIAKLINDRESLKDMPALAKPVRPRSLLNSERMFELIRQAFDGMDRAPFRSQNTPLADEVDLFVTTTDIGGLPVRLKLGGDEVATERRYRHVFHLRQTDFTREDNEFLAFCARCTSSFPVAFEPTQYRILNEDGQVRPRWAHHFADHDEARARDPRSVVANSDLSFGDGGYLDNKPFGYAIDALARRGGSGMGRVERKLLYIDPDPESASRARRSERGQSGTVNAIDNALFAFNVPRYETIREELLRLRDRNRLVEKVNSVVRGIDADFTGLSADRRAALAGVLARHQEFQGRKLEDVINIFGASYGGYHRIKVAQLTDALTEAVAARSGVRTESDEYQILRAIVRAWRDRHYYIPAGAIDATTLHEKQSEFAMLEGFDLAYRIRRLSFVLEQANRLRTLSPDALITEVARAEQASGAPPALSAITGEELAEDLDALRTRLADVLRSLRATRDALERQPDGRGQQVDRNLARELGWEINRIMRWPPDRWRDAAADDIPAARSQLDQTLVEVYRRVQEARDTAREQCQTILGNTSVPEQESPPWTTAPELARQILRHYYAWYELYDAMVFPLVYGSEVGEEVATVEPVRVSPLRPGTAGEDPFRVNGLYPAGAEFGHFGAFLDEDWRGRDLLLGRLNGAEKLVRTVMAGIPHAGDDAVADYVMRAQMAVIEEEAARADSFLARRLRSVAGNLDTPERRLDFIVNGEGLGPPGPPDRERMTDAAARAARVLGRVLDDAATGSPAVGPVTRLLVRAGQLTSALAEVAYPRSWLTPNRWILLALSLLVAFCTLGVGIVIADGNAIRLGLIELIVIASAIVAVQLMKLWLRPRKALKWKLLATLVALTVPLVGLGAIELWQRAVEAADALSHRLPWH